MKEIRHIFGNINMFIVSLVLAMIIMDVARVNGQTQETVMTLSFHKSNNQDISLKAVLDAKDSRRLKPLENKEIQFFCLSNQDTMNLGLAKTDVDGRAISVLNGNLSSYRDTTDFQYYFRAEFENDPDYQNAFEEIQITEANLIMELEVIDSIKTIFITATENNSTGQVQKIEECNISVYVPRLFGYQMIGEDYLMEGELEIEFPNNIVGDEEGNLEIIVAISDEEKYGNVEVSKISDWGKRREIVKYELPRSLWGRTPIWLAFLSVLLCCTVVIFLGKVFWHIWKIKKSG